MKYYLKILKESMVIVIASSIMGLFSGTLLSANKEILYAIPIIILILPSLNSLIGDISTVLVSRLTSSLYIGTIPPKVQKSESLVQNFIGLLITILLSLVVLVIFGYIIAITIGITIVNPFLIVFILIITIVSLFLIMFITLFISSIFIFKKGKDPNNIMLPICQSLGDFLTPLVLIILITLLL